MSEVYLVIEESYDGNEILAAFTDKQMARWFLGDEGLDQMEEMRHGDFVLRTIEVDAATHEKIIRKTWTCLVGIENGEIRREAIGWELAKLTTQIEDPMDRDRIVKTVKGSQDCVSATSFVSADHARSTAERRRLLIGKIRKEQGWVPPPPGPKGAVITITKDMIMNDNTLDFAAVNKLASSLILQSQLDAMHAPSLGELMAIDEKAKKLDRIKALGELADSSGDMFDAWGMRASQSRSELMQEADAIGISDMEIENQPTWVAVAEMIIEKLK